MGLVVGICRLILDFVYPSPLCGSGDFTFLMVPVVHSYIACSNKNNAQVLSRLIAGYIDTGELDLRPGVLSRVHFLHFAILLSFICVVANISISLMTRPRGKKQVYVHSLITLSADVNENILQCVYPIIEQAYKPDPTDN